jgi:hypothetical protein
MEVAEDAANTLRGQSPTPERWSMTRADLSSTTNRAPGRRPAATCTSLDPTPGSVEAGIASFTSPMPETSRNRPNIFNRSLAPCSTMSAPSWPTRSHVAPGGSIDRKYLLGLIADVSWRCCRLNHQRSGRPRGAEGPVNAVMPEARGIDPSRDAGRTASNFGRDTQNYRGSNVRKCRESLE